MSEKNYDGFTTEVEYSGYLAELEKKRIKHASRSPEAVRQARVHRKRRIALRYWEVYLRTGSRAESWLVVDGTRISDSIIEQARQKAVARWPEFAQLRGEA